MGKELGNDFRKEIGFLVFLCFELCRVLTKKEKSENKNHR